MTYFTQDLGGFEGATLQGNTVSPAKLARHKNAAITALSALFTETSGRTHALLERPFVTDDIAEIETIAASIRSKFACLVVIGTGGSSLGGKLLVSLAPYCASKTFPVLFWENVDPRSADVFLRGITLAETCFLFVSKSGSTLETFTQTTIIASKIVETFGEKALAKQCFIISDPKESALRSFGERYAIPTLDHPSEIGGRFSIFTAVGLLPAAVAGLDIKAIRSGAGEVIRAHKAKNSEGEAALGAAILHSFSEIGASINVLLPYSDVLQLICDWFRQIWAESLGKNGKGTTAARALGTVDQHSQIQIYLDGPEDKLFTFITLDNQGKGPEIFPKNSMLHLEDAFSYLQGKYLGDVMEAEQKATIETFRRNHKPFRVIHLHSLNEAAIGALLMHFMLETLITARLLEVDPFDQPAVEEGKILARELLQQSA